MIVLATTTRLGTLSARISHDRRLTNGWIASNGGDDNNRSEAYALNLFLIPIAHCGVGGWERMRSRAPERVEWFQRTARHSRTHFPRDDTRSRWPGVGEQHVAAT